MILNDRLLELVKILKMSQKDFGEKMGWTKQNAYHYYNGDTAIKAETIIKMKEQVPELNLNWFLFGEGEALLSSCDYAEEGSLEYVVRQDMIRILENQLNILSKQLENAAAESAHHRSCVCK